jgi:CRISPR/Cas system-associated exonuclease Cas4 (RecB family)
MDADLFTGPGGLMNEEGTSTMERGTEIHREIERRIHTLDSSNLPQDKEEQIRYAFEQISPYYKDDFEFFPERPLKFPLFGYMCSGIPDLLGVSKTRGEFVILDYKTGAKKPDAHFFQLIAYAYGVYLSEMIDRKKPIKLVLLYLGPKETMERFINFEEAQQELLSVWRNLYNLNQVTLSHCPACPYQNLCYSSVATN